MSILPGEPREYEISCEQGEVSKILEFSKYLRFIHVTIISLHNNIVVCHVVAIKINISKFHFTVESSQTYFSKLTLFDP